MGVGSPSRGYALLVAGFLALGVTACGGALSNNKAEPGKSEGSGSGPAVKIGFFAPITGPAAADGLSVKRAAELAVKEINGAGGINGRKIELLVEDDRLNPQEAVNIANKFIGQKVVAVVSGSYSGTTRAAAPVYAQANIPLITAYAVHPDITRVGKMSFRQSFIGDVQGRAGAEAAVKVLKAQQIAVAYIDNDFGLTLQKNFKEHAEKLGAKVVAVEKFPAGEKEFGPLLGRIQQAKPDLIYLVAYAGEGSQFVLQARKLGITTQILGTEGLDSTEQFLKVAGSAAEGLVITTNLNRDDERPVAKNFLANFKKEYGVEADMVGASTYDAFHVLANALKKAGTDDPVKIAEAIRSTANFEAVTGTIRGYSAGGEVMKPVQLQIVRNGAFRSYGQITDPQVLTPPQ